MAKTGVQDSLFGVNETPASSLINPLALFYLDMSVSNLTMQSYWLIPLQRNG